MAGKSATAFRLIAIVAMLAWSGIARAQVEIEYWQYTFAQRVQAIDELIKRFEAANPGREPLSDFVGRCVDPSLARADQIGHAQRRVDDPQPGKRHAQIMTAI